MAETLTYSKIGEWATDTRAPYRIASNLGHKIKTGIIPHYAELPSNADLADEWDVSERTALRAKQLLAEHGALRKEAGMYYVA